MTHLSSSAKTSVAVISPSRSSLYTLSVIELAIRNELPVSSVLVRRMFSWQRIRHEWRRDGLRLADKVWKKLVLKERNVGQHTGPSLRSTATRLGVEGHSVPSYCRQRDIPLHVADNLNSNRSLAFVDRHAPDMILFTGGGLIRKPMLDASPMGVLNCHAGFLPRFRGMDVVEWPWIEGSGDKVGQTVHLMDVGVDTGPLLKWCPLNIEPPDTFDAIRSRLIARAPNLMVDTAKGYAKGELRPRPQDQSEGQQYFVMHDRLQKIADDALEK